MVRRMFSVGVPSWTCCWLALALTAILTLAPAASVEAGTLVPYQGEPQKVTVASLVPHPTGDGNYFEQYNFEGTVGDGQEFYLRLRIANSKLGLGDGKMEVTVRAKHPQSGQSLSYSQKLDRDAWSFGKDRFEIGAGKTRVLGTPEAIDLQGTDKAFSFQLRFARQAEGWVPGGGKVRFDDDGYYATSIVFPRALISGTITVGGTALPVKGFGYATHTQSNRGPHEIFRRSVEFDSHDSDYAIYLRQFVPAKGYPQRPIGFLLVTYQDRVVFQSYDVQVQAEQTSVDGKTEARYLMPRRLVVDAQAQGQKVHGVLEGTELYLRGAVLEEESLVVRMVVKQLAEPVDYNFRCTYKFSLENAGSPPVDVGGRAIYRIHYLNK